VYLIDWFASNKTFIQSIESAESLGLSSYNDLVPHSNKPSRFLKTSKAIITTMNSPLYMLTICKIKCNEHELLNLLSKPSCVLHWQLKSPLYTKRANIALHECSTCKAYSPTVHLIGSLIHAANNNSIWGRLLIKMYEHKADIHLTITHFSHNRCVVIHQDLM